MGSWNGTCALTNLPILNGDKVALYILKKNSYTEDDVGGGFCYANCFYHPLPYVIYGEYDDYGTIENIEIDESWKILLDYFMRYQIEGDLIENIERNNIPGYSIIMIHRELHDQVIKKASLKVDFHYSEESGNLREHYEKMLNGFIKKYEEQKEFYKSLNREFFGMYESIAWDLNCQDFFVSNFLFGNCRGILFEKILDYILITSVFDNSRKFFFPQQGAGSQHEEYDLLKIMSDFVYKKAEEREREWEENNQEWEDD